MHRKPIKVKAGQSVQPQTRARSSSCRNQLHPFANSSSKDSEHKAARLLGCLEEKGGDGHFHVQ